MTKIIKNAILGPKNQRPGEDVRELSQRCVNFRKKDAEKAIEQSEKEEPGNCLKIEQKDD